MFKRSIYIVDDIAEGEIFTEQNIRIIRPGDGIHPRYFEDILGKVSNQQLKKGTPFSLNMI